MIRRFRATLLLALLLAACALLLARELRVDSDLSLFLPAASQGGDDRAAELLVGELREGAAARSLLLAISGGRSEQLASASRGLQRALAEEPLLRAISNGSQAIDPALRAWLMRHRYALAPQAAEALDRDGLHRALRQRLGELASNSALLSPAEVLRDPTAASLQALRQLLPGISPERRHGVWMSADGQRALLFAELAHGGFAMQQQQALVASIRAHFAALDAPGLRLELTGPAAFAVAAQQAISSESRQLSILASLAVMLILLISYRSPRLMLLAALPVASGVLVAITAVSLLFGSIHGITLAFGITVLGVAMDYPIHLFSHAARASQQGYRHIWPTLGLGLLTTSLGYCALLLSDFSGLAQLGVFAISGLCAAAAVTRWVLPAWLSTQSAAVARSPRAKVTAPPRLLRPLLLIASLGLLLAATLDSRDWLERDIAALSPIPAASKALDRQLRRALGAPEATHLIYVSGTSAQAVLERQEQLVPLLETARRDGLLQAFDAAARLLPSAATQRARLAALPTAEPLRASLASASAGLPLSAARFAGFIDEVQASRQAPALLPGGEHSAPIDSRLDKLLQRRDTGWFGPITLIGLSDAAALQAQVSALGLAEVQFLDLRATSSRMLDRFMRDALQQALWLGLLIAATLLFTQRRGGLRVSAAVLLALGGDVALLHLLGEALSIFHIIGLLLVLGIGLDYGLFRSRSDRRQQRATQHALRTCWLSTLAVFALLASSSIPVLHALGMTVAIGVSLCYLSSSLLLSPPAR